MIEQLRSRYTDKIPFPGRSIYKRCGSEVLPRLLPRRTRCSRKASAVSLKRPEDALRFEEERRQEVTEITAGES